MKNRTSKIFKFSIMAGAIASTLAVTGCGGGSSDGDVDVDRDETKALSLAEATFFVSSNGADNADQTQRVNQHFIPSTTLIIPAGNEGVDTDRLTDLYIANDKLEPSSITVFTSPSRRGEIPFANHVDRSIGGAINSQLIEPKGIAVLDRQGVIVVANFKGNNLQVFSTTVAGDVAPLGTTPLSADPWDIAYDDINDRLFVAQTDGTVAVFDAYVADNYGASTAARTITPVNANGDKISRNIHGIVFDSVANSLVVTDVGAAKLEQELDGASAGFKEDGQIFVIANASNANGNVQPARIIAGSNTGLGNPVDIILSNGDARVAEKANNTLLIFQNIFNGDSGNIRPNLRESSIKPESLVQEMEFPSHYVDTSDITSETVDAVIVSQNPSDDDVDFGAITQFSTNLATRIGTFNTGRSVESCQVQGNADVICTFDDRASAVDGAPTNNVGLMFLNRVATVRIDGDFDGNTDRIVQGDATQFGASRGAEIVDSHKWFMVANFSESNPGIEVMSTNASENPAPLFRIKLNGGRPWDMDYDPQSDRLFVAMTNGTVQVFDRFSALYGSELVEAEFGVTSSRVIVPVNSTGDAAVNIHGIVYDHESNSLILSDVQHTKSTASEDFNVDGRLYVISDADSADGLTNVSVDIAGPSAGLGNPVDIAFDGNHLYVAEKAQNTVLRFDNILVSESGDVSPSLIQNVTRPESITLRIKM